MKNLILVMLTISVTNIFGFDQASEKKPNVIVIMEDIIKVELNSS